MHHLEPDVVIVGAGIAGGALGTVLARGGFEVVLLEHENSYPDRVRGEFMAPWGVTELAKLELLQPLREAGALFTRRNIPYDENFAPAEAEARAFDLTKMHAEGFGGLCLGHPATCDIFARLATTSGASVLRGAGDITVTSGSRPIINCVHDGASLEMRPRLVIGADGRNSSVRKDLGFKVNADEPRNLLGGMLVKGVPSWPRDMQVIGVEGRFNFLVFPQGDDLLRLYGCYHFADKSRFDGPDRRTKLIDAFEGSPACPMPRRSPHQLRSVLSIRFLMKITGSTIRPARESC